MVLQKLQFPQAGICDRKEMYIRTNDQCTAAGDSGYQFSFGGVLTTNTYFNSFSVGKWRRFTRVHDVSIEIEYAGAFRLVLYHAKVSNDNLSREVIGEFELSSDKKKKETFFFHSNAKDGIFYFELTALKDEAVFYTGNYVTGDDFATAEVNIAIGICTFKREAFVKRNIQLLKDMIIGNPESVMWNHLEVFISDNSQTLEEDTESNQIHIFKNKNLGGSGGFTRAMLEILHASEEKQFTHILLMDDDIIINPESLILTYTFLRCLKPEYKGAFLGGHMLNNDRMNIQSEAADYFDSLNHHPVKPKYDLEQEEWIIKNEIEESVNCTGWWYCCIPINTVSSDNLPLPFFIKRDDLEYGLRNGAPFITMNGICVWHEPFEYKTSAHLEYYYFRNLCVLLSIHKQNIGKKQLIRFLIKRVGKSLITYRYKNAEFALWGINDFLKGFDWFKAQDGEEINKALMKHNYRKIPIEDIPWVFQYKDYTAGLKYKESKLKRLIRVITLNGIFLRAKKSVLAPMYRPHAGLFFRARRALNYEDATKSGFITYRDNKAAFILIGELLRTISKILGGYDKVKADYAHRYRELTNIDFWEEYLNRSGEPVEFTSKLPLNGRPKNKPAEMGRLFGAYLLMGLQRFLSFIPVKKNRIMIYNHDRKGFSCNPKYILKALEKQGNRKYEIFWVTKFPETCKEHDPSVKVIRANSKEHFLKYLRTRVYITNDCFPGWAVHSQRHKWINTWHGAISYKHIGYDYIAPMSTLKLKWFRLCNRQPDYFLSASEVFTEDTSKSFYFDKNCFVEYGFPRNDIFFHDNKQIQQKVRETFGIEASKKIVLYAPTFRRGMKTSFHGLDFELLQISLKTRFGGEWVVLFRDHNFVKRQKAVSGITDASGYDDMNELLCAADVLISDYSSCMYDFSLQFKPCFVFAPDIEKYQQSDRDFAIPPKQWPYPIAKTNDELAEKIVTFEKDRYSITLKEHFQTVGGKDDGNAGEKVFALIEKITR